MKKILLFLSFFVALSTTAQVAPTTFNNVKIVSPVLGAPTDSVVVWRGSGDKILRFVPLSTMAPTKTLQQTLLAGNTTDQHAVFSNGSGSETDVWAGNTEWETTGGRISAANYDGFTVANSGLDRINDFDADSYNFHQDSFSKMLELKSATLTADRVQTFQNKSGTVALTSDIDDALEEVLHLSGTGVGEPMTGDVEFNSVGSDINKIYSDDMEITFDNDEGELRLFKGPTGITITDNDVNYSSTSLGETGAVTFTAFGVSFTTTETASKGITGQQDYSANITNLDYPQKIYVDTAISSAGAGHVPFTGAAFDVDLGGKNISANLGNFNGVQVGATTETGFNFFSEVEGNINNSRRRLASNTNTHSVGMNHQRSRGTLAAKTAIQSGDRIAVYSFGGYDGTAFQNTSRIIASANENFVAGSNLGTKLVIETTKLGTTADYESLVIAGDLITAHGTLVVDNAPVNPTDAVRKIELDLKAPLASPALTGTPTAPTQTANDNSTKIATTAYVDALRVEYPDTAYSQTITYTGTAPTGAFTGSWRAERIGKLVNARMVFKNATPGVTVTVATIPWPTGLPLPEDIAGFNGNNDFFGTGSGFFQTSTTSSGVSARVGIRKVSTGVYEIYVTGASGSYTGAVFNFQYFIP